MSNKIKKDKHDIEVAAVAYGLCAYDQHIIPADAFVEHKPNIVRRFPFAPNGLLYKPVLFVCDFLTQSVHSGNPFQTFYVRNFLTQDLQNQIEEDFSYLITTEPKSIDKSLLALTPFLKSINATDFSYVEEVKNLLLLNVADAISWIKEIEANSKQESKWLDDSACALFPTHRIHYKMLPIIGDHLTSFVFSIEFPEMAIFKLLANFILGRFYLMRSEYKTITHISIYNYYSSVSWSLPLSQITMNQVKRVLLLLELESTKELESFFN